jgi:flagellar hook-associated protein 2
VVFTDLPAVPVPVTGTLLISQGGIAAFNVDFSTADINGDDTLSQSEMARAINAATNNNGKVTASVMTTGSTSQLVLTAASTGEAGRITLNASGLSNATLKAKLGAGSTLVQGQDAIVWLGAQGSGVEVQQASNRFTGIQGVTVTLTQAQATGATPVNLTVAGDNTGTAANVRTFVDAFNTLKTALDGLTQAGNSKSGVTAGTFSTDASIRALRNRLDGLVREGFGGMRLSDFGVSSDRSGKLTLDTAKLEKKLAASPDGLDAVFGSASLTSSSGLLGATHQYLDVCLDSINGQIKRRQDGIQTQQAAQTTRQSRIDAQYESAYQRYLLQFSALQTLQAQMEQTGNAFDAMTGST